MNKENKENKEKATTTPTLRGVARKTYECIFQAKSHKLKPETKLAYTLLRIELSELEKQYNEAHKEAYEQLHDENSTQWQEELYKVLNAWLSKPCDKPIDLKIFSFDDYVDFISSNELEGNIEDAIYQLMVKNNDEIV